MSFRAFEAALAKAVDEGKIAGAVALVTDRDGVTYEHAAGLRAVGQPAAMDGATVFWIASMTKAVVSVAALQLVERGKLTLDGDLGELCPDLKDLQVLEGVAEGKPRLRPAKGFVTLRQLLSHTSGFAYTFSHPEFLAFSQTEGALDPNSGSRAAHRQPLMFDPGQGWIYGIGIDWAGIVIEAASRQRLDAYLAENIFAPLAMFDTGFALSEGQAPRKASVHVRGPDGALIAIPFGLPANPEVLSGGGGLYSTAADYGKFLRMLLGDGGPVLSARTLRSLSESHSGAHKAGYIKSAMATMSNDFDLYPHMATGHGLATMITPEPTGDGRGAGSLAWAGLANTYYWADPEAGQGGVLMTQLLPFADPEVLSLLRALERGAYGLD
ncbi:MAG: serine hydrolase domain-containing protein [Phenylobacterium sp.]|uniref:serine hydrolase domain-containing protein n=1 Tax=Phenylobacterium sp. TaxID=1871053 RepID=UPI00271A733F|nr:serine hydrolase domain-containing protein [Phenylobacterium sp.]MDO8912555.1 serine hydrolase domain-containing protein [Phenylobacterium sp.]MDP3101138.1 serine hydrolase domain-containing protein [Phenylobacterium sp.]